MKTNILKRMWNRAAFAAALLGVAGAASLAQSAPPPDGSICSIHSSDAGRTFTSPGQKVYFTIRLGAYGSGADYGLVPKPSYEAVYGINTMMAMFPLGLKMSTGGYARLYTTSKPSGTWNEGKTDFIFVYEVQPGDIGMPLTIAGDAGSDASGDRFTWQNSDYWAVGNLKSSFTNDFDAVAWGEEPGAVWRFGPTPPDSGEAYDVDLAQANIQVYTFDFANAMSLNVGDSSSFTLNLKSAYSNAVSLYVWSGDTNYFTLSTQGGALGSGSNTVVAVTFDANSTASSPFVINGLKTTEGLPGGTSPIYASLRNGFDATTTNQNYCMSAPVTVYPTTPTIRVSPAESSTFFTESDVTMHTLNVTLSEAAPASTDVTLTCDTNSVCLVTNSVPLPGASEVTVHFLKNNTAPEETVAFRALDGDAATQISAKPTTFYTTVRGASLEIRNAEPVVNGLGNTTANTDYEKTFSYAVGDVAADSGTMELTFDWPDGKQVVTGGVGIVTHTFTSADVYTVNVQAKDKDGGYSGIVTFTVTVTDVTPPPTVSVEPPPSWPLTETGQYHIDETNQVGYAYVTLSKVYQKGEVKVKLSAEYPETGVTNLVLLTDEVTIPQGQTSQLISFAVLDGTAKSYTSPVKIVPEIANDASNTFTRAANGYVYVDNHAPAIGTPAEGAQFAQVSINTPQSFKFKVTDVNADVAAGMTLSWDWGDGTDPAVVSNGTFATDPVTYMGTFSGETNHTYTGIGTYTATLTVMDKDRSPVAVRTFTVYTATAPYISVAPNGMDSASLRLSTVPESDTALATPFIVYLSKPYTQNLSIDLTATPDSGKASLSPTNVTITAGSTQSEPVYFRPSDGTTTEGSRVEIKAAISKTSANYALATNFFNGAALGWRVDIQNMPPSLTVFPGGTTPAAPKLLQQNAISTFSWAIVDVTNDTQTLVWNFGDGTGNITISPADFNSWTGHTYTVAGDYEVTVYTKDKDGSRSETEHIYVSVVPGKIVQVTPLGPATSSYKPNGASWPDGLGAGWVESEDAGAYSISQDAYSFSYGSITKQVRLTAFPYRVNSAEDDATVTVTNWVSFKKGAAPNYNLATTTYDSFFYVWTGQDENTFADGAYATKPIGHKQVLVNMSEDATNVSAIAVNAIFSREYLASDFSGENGEVDLGDINLDGVPDRYAVLADGLSEIGLGGITWAEAAAQLAGGNGGAENTDYVATIDLGRFNMDADTNGVPVGDFLPMNLEDRSFVAGVSNVMAAAGAPFTGILEVRGFDEHLNWEREEDGSPLNPDFPLDEPGASASPLKRGGTNPCLEDTDGDGLPDGWEYYFWWFYGHDASESGAEDGRYNNYAAGLVGYAYCPTNITLGVEIKKDAVREAFNPIVKDASILSGSAPRDMDNDGLTDLEELTLGTNPLHWDTDGDGMCDKYEVEFGLNPNSDKDAGKNPDGDYMAYAEVNRLLVTVGETQLLADTDGERFWTFYKYGREDDAGAKIAQGRLLSSSEVAALGEPDLENAEGVTTVLVHFQVYMEFGFDPRVGWGKDANAHAKEFNSLDEYLVGKFMQNVCHKAGFAIKAKDLDGYTTNPRTPDTDATTKGHDGMPDGWELYVAPDFFAMRRNLGTVNPKSDDISTGWFPNLRITPWRYTDGSSNAGNYDQDYDNEDLSNAREFGGTISSSVYTNENLYATALTDDEHAPMVKNVTLARPGADVHWINKFWPTDPWVTDTDGDGLNDASEKAQKFTTGAIPTQNGWPSFETSFLYASNTVFTMEEYAHTKCFRGCGLNPCSMDSDHDGLPDGWEYQFAGTNRTSSVTGRVYVDGGMDGTHGPANNYKGNIVGDVFSWSDSWVYGNTGRRRDMDWDNDGLENYQEYWTMAVRGFRYDVSEFDLPMEGDGVDPSYFFTEITKDWDLAKICRWFQESPEWVMLPPPGASGYFSCDPRNPDSDFDGMDDYYELFHGLNPLLGGEDLIYLARGDVSATANSFGGSADEPLEMDFVKYPWLAGLPEADPDADGLLNLEECILGYGSTVAPANTDPSPLWATDATYTNSFVSRFYVPKGMFFWDVESDLYPSVYENYYVFSFEMNEGYDTDNDGISDKNELILTSTSQSEPQWTDDPIRRQALYLDGEQSAAVSFKWAPGVTTRLRFLEFTAELWARPEVVNREQVLLERPVIYPASDASTPSRRVRVNFRIGIKADGRVYAMFQNAGGHDAESGEMIAYGPTLTANEWVHIACVRDGTKGVFTLYVNGVFYQKVDTELMPANGLLSTVLNVDTGDHVTEITSVPGYIVVGAQDDATVVPDVTSAASYPVWSTFSNYYKGYIDEIRIWDGPRSGEQIYASFNRRFTKKDLLANRAEVTEKREIHGWTRYAGNAQLPAELIYHYTFDNLFGADVAASAATSPRGFMAPSVTINRPEGYVCPWWDSWETKSAVYGNYAYIPWIENLVAHLPSEKGYVQDSRYWTKSVAGKLPTAVDSNIYNFEEFSFQLEGDPYGLVYRNDTTDGFAHRKHAVTSTNDTGESSGWVLSGYKAADKEVLYMSDLLPLGNAWAKFCTSMWDNGTAGSVWAETGTDSDSDGLPDWWETYRFGAVDAYSWGDVDPGNSALTVGEAYMRDLAKGYTESNHPGASGYNASALIPQTSDADGDGLPDWWEHLYNLGPDDPDGDNGDLGDPDGDGLSNYAEYLVAEYWHNLYPSVFPVIRPDRFKSAASQADSDYFIRIGTGTTYLGELFADHDFMEDDWEDSYGGADRYAAAANRHLYDAHLDPDDDGWSNWSEARYGTSAYRSDPTLTEYVAANGDMICEYPVPSIMTTIRYYGSQKGPIVVETWSNPEVTGIPDARFTIPDGTEEVAKSKYLGWWGPQTVSGSLSPGSIVPGKIELKFTDSLSNNNKAFTTVIAVDRPNVPSTTGVLYLSEHSRPTTVKVGTINYLTGRFSFDLSQYVGLHYLDSSTTIKIWVDGAEVDRAVEFWPSNSYVTVDYAVKQTDHFPKVYCLADSDKSTADLPNKGHVREGLNYFHAFLDVSGDGIWQPGEPYGVASPVATKIGHDVNELEIELTDYQSGYFRFSPETMTRSEDSYVSPVVENATGDGGAPSGGGGRSGGGSEGASYATIRVYRSGVDGVKQYTRLLFEDKVKSPRLALTELDFLANGQPGFDWGLPGVGSGANPKNVGYDVYIGEGTLTTNSLVSYSFTNTFDLVQAQAVGVYPSDTYVYSARPTFRWTQPDNYPAFALRIYNSAGRIVYDSGIQARPPRNDAGECVWTAPIYANGFVPGTSFTFDSNQTYTWRVLALDAKFSSEASDAWSVSKRFRLDVNGADTAPGWENRGYGSIKARIKYHGPARTYLTNRVRFQVYDNAAFAGLPVAEMTLSSAQVDTMRSAAAPAVNARVDGILPTDKSACPYYALAYIDSNLNGERDSWESWGYANYYGRETGKPYDPLPVTVDTTANIPVVDIRIEDVDTDQDWLPDVWEYEQHPNSATFLEDTAPSTSTSATAEIQGLLGSLGTLSVSSTAAQLTLSNAGVASANPGLALLAGVSVAEMEASSDKLALGLAPADTVNLSLTGIKDAALTWTLEVGRDASTGAATRALLGADGGVCTYTVEYKATLDGTWKPLATGTVALENVQRMQDSIQAAIDANPKSCFFRVVLGR